jgi:hypothetical protein
MREDVILVASVALVWTLLALAYPFVPMLTMPGSVFVWGAGAVVFALLAAAILRAQR